MFKDKNGVDQFVDEDEERLYKDHHDDFGPDASIRKVHPDNCNYCKEKGWDTHPEKTTLAAKESQHRDHMAEYGPMTGESHPEDCEKCN